MTAVRVISEFGQSCRGDLDVAIAQALAAKDAGAWAAKWQTFAPERLVSKTAGAYWDRTLGGSDTQYDTFVNNGMLTTGQWVELKQACDQIGIIFLSSPFDLEAVAMLDSLGVEAIKVASGEITHKAMLRRIAETKRDVILSCGGATSGEIHRALDWLDGCEVTLLACDLVYPCPPGSANLSRIEGLSGFRVKGIGYSDHTTSTITAFGAALLGATVLEKHCTLSVDKDSLVNVVPDDKMALVASTELHEYCRLAQLGAAMRGTPYPGPSAAEQPALVGARRSLHAAKPIRKGHVFGDGDFVMLRPGDGVSPAWEEALYGAKATRTLRAGEKITKDDYST